MTARFRSALGTVAFAAAVLWWAPTFGLAFLQMAPHLASALGTTYRVGRIRRLIARGDLDEADRVTDALVRDGVAAERWRAGVEP